ncbi:MAG: hypothetical protein WAL56_09100 [Candidatus Sulfotelmatobacter sp.]
MTENGSLLIEGMKSYPKALAAITEFVSSVISTIREVLTEDENGLSNAVDVKITDEGLIDYLRPSRLSGSGSEDKLMGVRFDKRPEMGWSLYFYLWWSPAAEFGISLYFNDAQLAALAFNSLAKASGGKCRTQGSRELYFSRPLAMNDSGEFREIVRESVQDFSAVLSRAGGLKKLTKQTL